MLDSHSKLIYFKKLISMFENLIVILNATNCVKSSKKLEKLLFLKNNRMMKTSLK